MNSLKTMKTIYMHYKKTLRSIVYFALIFVTICSAEVKAEYELPNYSFIRANSYNVTFNADGDAAELYNLRRTETEKTYRVLSFGYKPMHNESIVFSESAEPDYNVEPKVIGKPLFYPNPFRLRENARLGYELSKDMDIEIRMYDMRGNEIFKSNFESGTLGGLRGYNTLYLTQSTFDFYDLPSGVYFFILIHAEKVLARGKFAIMP
jgi:hypothetical protein